MSRISKNMRPIVIGLIKSVLKQRPLVVIKPKSYRTITELHQSIFSRRLYSTEPKSKLPLGSLLSNAKERTEAIQDKPDEEETKKQRERSWRTMKITLWFFGVTFTCLGTYLVVVLGAPEKDEEGIEVQDQYSNRSLLVAYCLRTIRELEYYRRLIKEPSREKLLPDPLEYPYVQPKYTLVLELMDVLVHPSWTYKTGWRFLKRPMIDYFLETLKDQYEIIIYTAEQGMTVFPLVDAIDPKNIIAYKLVRDATHFSGGHHVKSLDKLNRDLSKVIVVDWNANNVKFNPENLFCMKRWTGKAHDTSLYDLTCFLKAIADNDIEDVREVLKVYSKYDDPIAEFIEKQKRLIDQLEAHAAAKREQEKNKVSRWMPSFLKKSY